MDDHIWLVVVSYVLENNHLPKTATSEWSLEWLSYTRLTYQLFTFSAFLISLVFTIEGFYIKKYKSI